MINSTLPREPSLLTVGQMARQLRVPVRWLRAEAEAERVPHLKAETVLLFEPGTVEQVLVERARQGLVIPDVHTVDAEIRATKARLQALCHLRKAAERQEQTHERDH